MRPRSFALPFFCLMLGLAGCKDADKAPAPRAEMAKGAPAKKAQSDEAKRLELIRTAQERLAPFKKTLMGTLKTALAEGGPVAAIDVCRLKAPALTASAGAEGIVIGRTSTRLRNPKNQAPLWVKPLIAQLENAPSDKPARQAILIDEKRAGYVEAIHVKEPCLTCHGKNLGDEVKNALAAHYPDDQATGYALGDFRGLFWVELPRPQ
jgi:hypothetical protein